MISSKDNPAVKRLAKLMQSKKARREYGEFVIEGMRSCYDAACELSCGRLKVTGFYHTAGSLEKAALQFDVGRFDSIPKDLWSEISDRVAEKLSAGSSQGMFITAELLDKPFVPENIDPRGRYVVLCDLQDPGNIGTIMRSADAFGISGVVLAGGCCDLYNPKVIRSAMGSIARTNAFVCESGEAARAMFESLDVRNIASVVSGGEDIRTIGFSSGCAVYIGNEGKGLDDSFAKACGERVTISMQGSIDSLNAAMAATVMLWEMTRGEARDG